MARPSTPLLNRSLIRDTTLALVDEYGLAPDAVEVDISCTPAGAACPRSGATLRVTVATRVTLPLVPAIFGLDRIASVPIEAASVQKVSRFWGAG